MGQGVEVGGGEVLNTLQKIILRSAKRVLKVTVYNGGILSSFIWICLLSNIIFSGCLNILASSNQLFSGMITLLQCGRAYTLELGTNLVPVACVW